MVRHAFELEGRDGALRGDHVMVDAAEGVLVAAQVGLDHAPLAAAPRLELVDPVRVAARAPPLREQRRVGVRLENQLARRVEHPRHHDVEFAGIDDVLSL